MHANDTATASSLPSGLLIANDSDYKRTHLLIHQSARLPSPSLMVTNLDASIFPAIKIPSEQTTFPSSTKARVAAKRQYQLLFDRILCDVPCSGDGTLRKNLGIWKSWSPMDGNGLHRCVRVSHYVPCRYAVFSFHTLTGSSTPVSCDSSQFPAGLTYGRTQSTTGDGGPETSLLQPATPHTPACYAHAEEGRAYRLLDVLNQPSRE